MPTKRKTWAEKLNDDKGLPKVEKITDKMSKRWGSGTVAIPAPKEVDELMKRVPEGKLVTINEIRAALARKHKATIGCPITTGIFAWVAANAAEEDRQKRREGHYALLAHLESWRRDKRKIPWWSRGTEENSGTGRARGHSERQTLCRRQVRKSFGAIVKGYIVRISPRQFGRSLAIAGDKCKSGVNLNAG